jgi:hypothetical protein
MNKQTVSSTEVYTNIRTFFSFVVKKYPLIIGLTLLGGVAGFGAYFIQKPRYEAISTFIVEEKQSSLGSLSGIASQFGFDLGGISGGGGIFSGDNILDILKSKNILQDVLLSALDTASNPSETLADRYILLAKKDKAWKNTRLHDINFSGDHSKLTRLQDSALNIIYLELTKKHISADRMNRKGSIIKLSVNFPDESFAIELNKRLISSAIELYTQIKTGTGQENINRLQRRADSLLLLLNSKTYVAASSQILDGNPGVKAAIAPVEIASRDKSVIAAIYSEVIKNLEASKLLFSQQMPVIQLLDAPGQSLFDNRKPKFVLTIIGAFIFGFLTLLGITATYFLQHKNDQVNGRD